MRLDDDLARDLLRGMMRQPRAQGTPQGQRVRMETRLLVEGGLRLTRRPVLPPEISAATLASQLQVQADALPVRFALYLLWSDGTRQMLGAATRLSNKDLLRTSGQPGLSPGSLMTLVESVRLGANAGTRELGLAALDGVDLPPELPWVFTRPAPSGPYILQGCGPVRTRAQEALVVLPPDATWQAEPSGAATVLGSLQGLERQVVSVQGTLLVQQGDDRMTIWTRQDADEARHFVVQGEVLKLGAWGDEVFRGPPRVLQVMDGGRRQEVKAEWRPWSGREAPWKPLGPGALGDVALRVTQEGEVRFRSRVRCLPRLARCEVLLGAQQGEGTLRLRDAQVVDVGVPLAGIEVRHHQEGQDLILHLKAGQGHPRLVPLQLRLGTGARMEVRAMFPARQASFVGWDGQPMSSLVAVHRLATVRARVFEPSLHGKCLIQCQRQGRNWVFLAEIPQKEDGAFELSLDSVAEQLGVLLAASSELDDKVSLQIVANSRPQPQRLQVARYDAALDKIRQDTEGVEVRLDAAALEGLSPEERARLRLEARPLLNPKQDPKFLTGTAEQGWRLDLRGCQPGAWLLTTWLGDLALLRPLRVTVPGEPSAELKLDRASHVHVRSERLKALREVVGDAATDAALPDWLRLRDFLSTLGSLPASTFEVVRCMAENPSVAVLVVALRNRSSGVRRTRSG